MISFFILIIGNKKLCYQALCPKQAWPEVKNFSACNIPLFRNQKDSIHGWFNALPGLTWVIFTVGFLHLEEVLKHLHGCILQLSFQVGWMSNIKRIYLKSKKP